MPIYWLYENWELRRIRVHLNSCTYCNDGKGWKRSAAGKTGRWHGPYISYRDTFEFSRGYKAWDIADCPVCIRPRHPRSPSRDH